MFLSVNFEKDVVSNIKGKLEEKKLVVEDLETEIVGVKGEKVIKISVTFEKGTKLDNLYDFVNKIESDYTPIELKLSHE